MNYINSFFECIKKDTLGLKFIFVSFVILILGACSTGDPKTSVAEAKSLYMAGEFKAAIIELKKMLKQYPNNGDARFVLGDIYVELGDGESAIKELSRAKKYGVASQRLDVLLAEANYLNGDFDKALSATDNYNSLPIESRFDVILLRVAAFMGKNDTDSAEKLLSLAESMDKNNVNLLLAQSRYALLREDYKKLKYYLSVLEVVSPKNNEGLLLNGMLHLKKGAYKKSLVLFDQVISKLSAERFGQNEFEARVGNIQALLALNDKNRAKQAIQDFLIRSPGHPTPLYFDAVVKYDEKNYSSVRDNLQRVLTLMPEHYPSLLLLGAANFADKNYEQANKYLTKFVDRVPTHVYARKLLGVTKLRLDRSEEALVVLKEGVGDAETDSGLLSLIGRVAMRTDIGSAINYFEKATKTKPENIGLRKQLAKVYIANGEIDKAIEALNFVGGESVLQAESLEVISFLKKQEYAKARLLADKLLVKHPADSRFYMVRAAVEISAGYKQAAEKYLKKSIDLKNDNVVAMISLAKLKIQSGELTVANDWLERVVKIQPNSLQAKLGLAEIAERQGFPNTAIEILQQAGKDHPNEYIPHAVLAGFFLQKGKAKAAHDLLTKALNDIDHPDLWQLLGRSYEEMKDWEGARDSYKKMISVAPQSTFAYVSLAKIYVITGDKQKAEEKLNMALKINPNFSPAWASLAGLAISNADYKKANKIGHDLIVKSPKSPLGYLVLANTALAEKKYLESKKNFITAFSYKPNRAALLNAYARFKKAGQKQVALDVLQEWLKQFPSDNTARLFLATIYQENDRFEAAEREYRQLLKTRPNDPVILNNLALLRLSSDPLEAKKFAAKAYESAKSNAAIADTFGWVLVKNGEFPQGLKILEEVAQKNRHPDIQYHLAFALANTGQKPNAKSILVDILANNPTFAERAQAEKLLAAL